MFNNCSQVCCEYNYIDFYFVQSNQITVYELNPNPTPINNIDMPPVITTSAPINYKELQRG
jgi:hypothetical protein